MEGRTKRSSRHKSHPFRMQQAASCATHHAVVSFGVFPNLYWPLPSTPGASMQPSGKLPNCYRAFRYCCLHYLWVGISHIPGNCFWCAALSGEGVRDDDGSKFPASPNFFFPFDKTPGRSTARFCRGFMGCYVASLFTSLSFFSCLFSITLPEREGL